MCMIELMPVFLRKLEVNSQTLFTDAGGLASLELGNGSYPYEVSKEGYYNSLGTAIVANSNSEVSVELAITVSTGMAAYF
ncbi:hypothetical protein MASR1M74_19310 [Lentimicrobium sp.]